MKNTLLRLVLPLLLFSACAPLPLTNSYWEGRKTNDDDVHISYFDNDHKISCTVTNDSTNLYVLLETNNKSIQRGILRQGATVYIDTAAKHSQKMYARYPLEGVTYNKKDKEHEKTQSEQGFQNNYRETNRIISGFPTTIAWNNGTEEQVSNFAVEKTGLKAKMYVDSMGYTIYRVSIPLLFISKKGFSRTTPFSVGIKIDSGSQSGAGKPDAGGGFAGGAGFAGAGGMGGRGGQMNGAPSGRMSTATNIWFVTQLNRKP